MKIHFKGDNFEFRERINNLTELISYLRSINFVLNYENPEIIKKLINLFNILYNENGKILSDDFKKYLFEKLDITSKNSISKKSLKQRGFTDEEIEIYKEQFFNGKYNFNNNIYILNKEPVCNICNSKLKLTYRPKYNDKWINGCSNEDCKSKNGLKMKYEAFLPESLRYEPLLKLKNNSRYNKNFWIGNGYSEDESIEIICDLQKTNNSKKKTHHHLNKSHLKEKLRYTDEEIEYFYKSRNHFSPTHWVNKGLNEEDANIIVSEIQTKNANKFVEKRKANPEKYFESTINRVEYWVKKGYDKAEAVKIISKQQNRFSLDICVNKYGELDGLDVFNKRQDKWQESLHNSKNLHVGYSKVSQELFDSIYEMYEKLDKDFIFYGSKNREFSIKGKGGVLIYDFCDLKNRKLIEFNGDIFHGNPLIYKSTDTPNPFKKDKTCSDLWEYDKFKKEMAEQDGFELITIWEKEYRSDKNKTINKCKVFLKL